MRQSVATLGLAPGFRHYRDAVRDLPGKIEQRCRLARQQFKFQFAKGNAPAFRHYLSHVQRHLDDAAIAPAYGPARPVKTGDKAGHQRPKQAAVRIDV